MFTCTLWRMTLAALAIAHRRGPPYQPWHNGRMERLWWTLKAPLRQMRLATSVALQAALDQFTEFYNTARPHQSLSGLTPDEAWHGRTMADVQHAHACADVQWVGALDGLLANLRV